jgi:hypothetical protein
MRWLVGSVVVTCSCCVAAAALAQAPKAAPAPTATFPGEPPAHPPTPAPAPTPGLAPVPAPAPAIAPAPGAPPPDAPPSAEIPLPPPAAPPAAAAAPAPAPAPRYVEPPLPPPRETDLRPIRQRRPFFIGGELGWNGLSGLGVNFSYHFVPYLALDTGLGLSLTGLRVGGRLRANFLPGEWTPFLAAGMSYAAGTGGQDIKGESHGEETRYKVLGSPFAQFGGGVNYTGSEGFVFMATTGYSILLKDENAEYVSGSVDAYEDIQAIFEGGLILSVAFGYAF